MHNKTVFDTPKEKHPEPREASVKMFIPCDELPPLIEVDVTVAHVEKVAHQIWRGAGTGNTLAVHWQDFLLRNGARSEHLREAIAELLRYLANSIVE